MTTIAVDEAVVPTEVIITRGSPARLAKTTPRRWQETYMKAKILALLALRRHVAFNSLMP